MRPGFKLPPLMLTDDEALAITLSLIAARRQGIAVEVHLTEGALAKIERVLPAELRQRLQALEAAVAFTPTAVASQPSGETLLLVSAAAQQQRTVQITYESEGGQTVRQVDPYGIVAHWDRWYLAGWCHLRQDVRTFRLDRVLSATVSETFFTRPAGFDSLDYVLKSLATIPRGWFVEVLVETTLAAVQQHIPPDIAILEQQADGILMRFHSDHLATTARYLLLLESPFVVRQPQELREALRQVAADAMALAEREG